MKKCLILLLLCFLPLSLVSWTNAGHMCVAKIAYDRLDPAVRAEADRLIQEFAPCFPASADFVTAACWADDISHDDGLKAFSAWHSSSLPYDPQNTLSGEKKKQLIAALEKHDAIHVLEACAAVLKNPKASTWTKALMLRFLIHVVGDIHQPLHCTTLYSKQFPAGDKGGNQFAVSWTGPKKNLHNYWDSVCGLAVAQLSRPLNNEATLYVEALAQQATTRHPESKLSQAKNLDFKTWREESYRMGCDIAYKGISPAESPSSSYEAAGQEATLQRMALAGYRLARLLNNTLKASSSLSRP